MKRETQDSKEIRRHRTFVACCTAVLAVALAAIVFAISAIAGMLRTENAPSDPDMSGISSEPSGEEPVRKIATATVVSTGDIILHDPVITGAYNSTDGSYDFSSLFKSASSYFKNADLAVANLEVTLGGTQSGAYAGYPLFNSPDSLADAIKSAGINLLLTSNNHCYDTGLYGLKRTVQVLKERKIDFIGTRENDSDPRWLVRDVNGIKIGITNFTYETAATVSGRKSINGNVVSEEANTLINSFSYENINVFYSEAETMIAQMRAGGADCIVFYMHWGDEYKIKQNAWQETIAQRLCNMGIDVIVGSHPHVIQPVKLLHSEDSQNTTVCLYSTGNAISNQRQELMDDCPSGHTEDGVLFYYTFEKYSDGTTVLSAIDLIPTWVDKYRGGSGYLYQMYPIEKPDDAAKYGLTGTTATRAQASYERTRTIVAAGLTECQNELGCAVRFPEGS